MIFLVDPIVRSAAGSLYIFLQVSPVGGNCRPWKFTHSISRNVNGYQLQKGDLSGAMLGKPMDVDGKTKALVFLTYENRFLKMISTGRIPL